MQPEGNLVDVATFIGAMGATVSAYALAAFGWAAR